MKAFFRKQVEIKSTLWISDSIAFFRENPTEPNALVALAVFRANLFLRGVA